MLVGQRPDLGISSSSRLEASLTGNGRLMWDAGTALLLDHRYRLDQQIASGELSDIWRGTDVVLARPVAVKLLRAGVAADTPEMARFRTAARHAGLLAHENIARVYDYDESGGSQTDGSQPPFMVMEFVDGPSLGAVLAGGPLEPARVMDLIAQSAAGLHAVHRAGLVHGDIRPETLLLGPDDVLKVTHFGASSRKPPAPRFGPGGPACLAPDRAAGGSGTPAADLYSLGLVAYQCLAGSPALGSPALGSPALGSAPVGGGAAAHPDNFPQPLPLPQPLPDTVPATVALLVSELLDPDPARRPRDAAEVARRAGRLRDELIPGLLPAPAGSAPPAPAAPPGADPVQATARWQVNDSVICPSGKCRRRMPATDASRDGCAARPFAVRAERREATSASQWSAGTVRSQAMSA